MLIWFKEVSSVIKIPISNFESFLESFWDLNKVWKTLLTQNHEIKSLTQLTCFTFPLKIREMLWWYEKCRKIKVLRRLGDVRTKPWFAQTILNEMFGSKQGGPVKLDGAGKVRYVLLRVFSLLFPELAVWGGDGAVVYVSTQICYFPNISFFPTILNLKSLGNSYTNISILDITFRFTCG